MMHEKLAVKRADVDRIPVFKTSLDESNSSNGMDLELEVGMIICFAEDEDTGETVILVQEIKEGVDYWEDPESGNTIKNGCIPCSDNSNRDCWLEFIKNNFLPPGCKMGIYQADAGPAGFIIQEEDRDLEKFVLNKTADANII